MNLWQWFFILLFLFLLVVIYWFLLKGYFFEEPFTFRIKEFYKEKTGLSAPPPQIHSHPRSIEILSHYDAPTLRKLLECHPAQLRYIVWNGVGYSKEKIQTMMEMSRDHYFIMVNGVSEFFILQNCLWSQYFLEYYEAGKFNPHSILSSDNYANIVYQDFICIFRDSRLRPNRYRYSLLQHRSAPFSDSPHPLATPFHSIPPHIIQTWVDHQTNVYDLKKKTEKLLRKNPELEYTLFSDSDMKKFIVKHYPEILTTYDAILPSAFRSDFFRYLYLYKHGGIYLDISYMPLISFKDLTIKIVHTLPNMDQKIRLGLVRERPSLPTCLYNGFMMAEPGHPVMKQCIDLVVQYVLEQKTIIVTNCLSITGPCLLGEAFLILYKNIPKREESEPHDTVFFDFNSPYIQWKRENILQGKYTNFFANTKKMYSENNKKYYGVHCIMKNVIL